MKGYGYTYLLIISHSHNAKISKSGSKNLILKQPNYLQGQKNIQKFAFLVDNYN